MNGVIDTPLQFGVGDGSTTTFALKPLAGELIAQVLLATLYRTDWQGRQLLYATPRTNYLLNSRQVGGTNWVNSAVTATLNAGVGPDGQMSASLLTSQGNVFAQSAGTAAAVTVGQNCFASTWFRKDTATEILIIVYDSTITHGIADVALDLSGATPVIASSSNVVGTPTLVADNYGGWRIEFEFVAQYANLVLLLYPDLAAGVNSTYYTYPQLRDTPGSYIPTTTAPVTVTDYVLGATGEVTMASAPVEGAVLDWTGTYIYTPTEPPSNFPLNTIISQFANSPTLVQLIENMSQYIDPSADIDAFYEMVWDLDSAQGVGLDIWGKIVGLDNGRLLKIPSPEINFGFAEAGVASAAPFGQGVFYSGVPATQNYSLGDPAFKTLILVKAMANISDGSIPSYNQLLQNLFAGRGRCYVSDLGDMQMRYTFEFYLEPWEEAVLTQSGALPRPTGVLASIMQVPLPNVFGFAEAGAASAAPFGQGTFFTGTTNAS